jgi:porin
MPAPVASGWSGRRVGLAPTGKRRLFTAHTHSRDYGVYGFIDQMLWRLPGNDPKKGVGAFARATFSPFDRNLIDLYAEAGVNFMGLWDKRPDDNIGLATSFSQLSPDLRELDLEKNLFEKSRFAIA